MRIPWKPGMTCPALCVFAPLREPLSARSHFQKNFFAPDGAGFRIQDSETRIQDSEIRTIVRMSEGPQQTNPVVVVPVVGVAPVAGATEHLF
jgi:hypothetical protein